MHEQPTQNTNLVTYTLKMSLMFELPNFPILITLFVFIFMLAKHQKKSKSKPNLPPGPWKIPIIGNIHQMAGGIPTVVMRNLALKHGPIMTVKLGETNAVIVSSAKVAEEVMKKNDIIFAQRPKLLAVEIMSYNFSSMAFAPFSHYWRQVRKLSATELLSAKRVQAFRSLREEEGANFVDYISSTNGKEFNFSNKVFSVFNTIIFKAASGRNCKNEDEFISVVRELIILCAGFSLHDIFPSVKCIPYITGARSKLESYHKKVDKILDAIIDDHKSGRKEGDEEDVLDVLLKIQNRDASEFTLTTDNIKAIIMDIFAAGGETQATVLEWGMSELLKNPKVLKRAQKEVREALKGKQTIREEDIPEIPYLKALIKEILRTHPPAPIVPREAREDCQINGYDIPKKTKVIINLWAMFRDPSIWPNPDVFDPERFLGSQHGFSGSNIDYIPFGAGRRICPGLLFALASLDFIFAKVLFHFDWKLPEGIEPEGLDMTELFGASSRRKNDLYVIATPFNSQVA